MVINHNISALNTFRQLSANNTAASKSLQKLSSGLRINGAADDAAGLAISEKMKGQIRGLDQASRNAQDGISLIQTAEGALNETHGMLQRIRELAVQSASDTNTDADRAQIQMEVNQLTAEIDGVSTRTQFNTMNLLDGSLAGSPIVLQIGANAGQNTALSINDMSAAALGVAGGGTSTSTVNGANITSTLTGTPAYSQVAGEAVTLTYAAGTAGTAGTPATSAGWNFLTGRVVDLRASIGAASSLQLSISFDGGPATTYSAAEFRNWNGNVGVQNGTDLYQLIASKLPANTSLDGFTWGLFSTTTGSASTVQWDVTGGTAAERSAVQLIFGFVDDSVTAAGTDAVPGIPGTPSTVTFADNNGNSVAVNVLDTDTSFAGSGYFSGLNVSLAAGKALTDLTGDPASTITFATVAAPAAGGIDISTQTAANAAISVIDGAISSVSSERANLGAMQNRLEHTINNLEATSQNLTASASQIADADMAREMMEYTKNSILSQAAAAMLAQANQTPQGVLQLLKSA